MNAAMRERIEYLRDQICAHPLFSAEIAEAIERNDYSLAENEGGDMASISEWGAVCRKVIIAYDKSEQSLRECELVGFDRGERTVTLQFAEMPQGTIGEKWIAMAINGEPLMQTAKDGHSFSCRVALAGCIYHKPLRERNTKEAAP